MFTLTPEVQRPLYAASWRKIFFDFRMCEMRCFKFRIYNDLTLRWNFSKIMCFWLKKSNFFECVSFRVYCDATLIGCFRSCILFYSISELNVLLSVSTNGVNKKGPNDYMTSPKYITRSIFLNVCVLRVLLCFLLIGCLWANFCTRVCNLMCAYKFSFMYPKRL